MNNHFELNAAEAEILRKWHTTEADYFLACKQANVRTANITPLYKIGDIQTKQDWLNRAAYFDERRKYHRKRARIFASIVNFKTS